MTTRSTYRKTQRSMVLWVTLLAGCSAAVTQVEPMPDDGVHGAIIEWEGTRDIRIPDTAQIDQSATVEVLMWVGGSVAPRELSVVETERGFRIEATADYGSGWLDLWGTFAASTELEFAETGEYEIEVTGRSMPGYTPISHVEYIQVVAP